MKICIKPIYFKSSGSSYDEPPPLEKEDSDVASLNVANKLVIPNAAEQLHRLVL